MPDGAPFPAIVRALRYEAEDVISVELSDPDDTALPPWRPGDHIDVHLRPNLIRQYSLCGTGADPHRYLIAVKREPKSRGGSEYVHTTLRPGDLITIAPPRTKFPLAASPHPAILVAAGIGITPIASMARALQTQAKPFSLHYFSRAAANVVFAKEWTSADFRDHAQLYLGLGADDVRTDLDKLARNADSRSHMYVCGPDGFMTTALNSFEEAGFDTQHLHFEKFTAGAPASKGAQPGSSPTSFTVHARQSGIETEVREDESIVDALARCGIDVPVSCEQGICGTCVSRVIAGTPDHRDDYLTDAEKATNSELCPCVSRSKSEVLELDL